MSWDYLDLEFYGAIHEERYEWSNKQPRLFCCLTPNLLWPTRTALRIPLVDTATRKTWLDCGTVYTILIFDQFQLTLIFGIQFGEPCSSWVSNFLSCLLSNVQYTDVCVNSTRSYKQISWKCPPYKEELT